MSNRSRLLTETNTPSALSWSVANTGRSPTPRAAVRAGAMPAESSGAGFSSRGFGPLRCLHRRSVGLSPSRAGPLSPTEQRHRVVHHGRRRHRHLPQPPVSATSSCPPLRPCALRAGRLSRSAARGSRYPRVKEARRVQYPPDVARKMCNSGPITPVDDRLVASGRYCTLIGTGDGSQDANGKRSRPAHGGFGEVEAEETVGRRATAG